MKNLLIYILLLFLFIGRNNAQELGEYPTSIRWNQINTDTVRVIFPEGMEKYALRVTNLTTELQKNHNASIGQKHRKLNIVLRNQTVISNGYVGLGPFRSEFYTTPPSQNEDLGTLPWLDLLSVHEYRHAMQFSNSNRGLSRFWYFLMGDYGLAAFSNISVPNWFWEGDAVCNETALSPQGRGRIPSFYLGFKTLEQNNTRYTYMKARNGSFRDYVPNHYELGYLMCSYGRNKFNNNVWNKVFENGVAYNYYIYPFSRALKANTGIGTVGLYKQALNSYSNDWKKQREQLTITPTTPVNTDGLEKVYSNYLFPANDGLGGLVCLKKSFNRPATFVQIDKKGHEQALCLAGLTLEENFSYSNNYIAWTQYRSDIRWSGLIYSDIVLYNNKTKEKKTITTKGKYFSPNISSVKPEIVAVFTDKPDRNKLVIINYETNSIIKEIGADENYFYTNPVFDLKGEKIIAAVRNTKGQAAIVEVDIATGKHSALTPFSYNTLGKPICTSTGIYFTASYSGIDNLYCIDKQNNIKQVSSVETGVSAATIDTTQQRIALSVYRANGYKLEYLSAKDAINQPITITEPEQQSQFSTAFAKQEGGNILDSIPVTNRTITHYNTAAHLFRIHSWQYLSNGQNSGLLIYTNNTLNTLTGTAGFIYNKNEKRPYITGDILYAFAYPILHLAANTTLNESGSKDKEQYYFNKQEYQMGLQLPLSLSRGSYNRSLTTEIGVLRNQINVSNYKNDLTNNYAQGYYASLTFSNQKQAAYQNLASPMGQLIQISYKNAIEGISTKLFRADGFFSVKGLFPNHNIKLQANYGKQSFESNSFLFTDNFYHTPGYKAYNQYTEIKRVEASYHLPLCYPDFGFGGLMYFKRIQLAGYYNYSSSDVKNLYFAKKLNMNSTGAEITFDTKLLNLLPVSWVIRYNYRLSKIDDRLKGNDFEVYLVITSF